MNTIRNNEAESPEHVASGLHEALERPPSLWPPERKNTLMKDRHRTASIHTLSSVCRMDATAKAAIVDPKWNRSERSWCSMVVIGMAATGAAFGFWRAPQQALISAVKMPFMMLSTVWLSAIAATMLAWLLGLDYDFRQVRRCILSAMAASSVLLASLSPIILFLASTLPGSNADNAIATYRILLGALVASVGCSGLLGTFRLHRLLLDIAPSRIVANRTLMAWIVVMGLVGTQTSWLLSPFVQRPTLQLTFWNPLAFKSNFFEYLWSTLSGNTFPETNP